MFVCYQNINNATSNKDHVKSAISETCFSALNDYEKSKESDLLNIAEEHSRIEIINYIIAIVEDAERHGDDPSKFVRLFDYLSDKFKYCYKLDCENTSLLTCYKFRAENNFDKFSIPVSRIKYIMQHDRTIIGAHSDIQTLSHSRVSCVTEFGEEFIIHPVNELMISLRSDLVYQSAATHLNKSISFK